MRANGFGIGDRLSAAREFLGLDQESLAASLGLLSRNTVYKWEHGLNFPPADVLAIIREKFGISIDWLVAGKGSMMAGKSLPLVDIEGRCERYRRIRSMMVLKGITFTSIARQLNLSIQHVRLVVAGERESLRVLEAMIKAGIPRCELITVHSLEPEFNGCSEASSC